MKVAFFGTIERRQWGSPEPQPLFLGTPIPILAKLRQLAGENGMYLRCSLEIEGEPPLTAEGMADLEHLLGAGGPKGDLSRASERLATTERFRIGEVDFLKALEAALGKRAKLRVEFRVRPRDAG